MPCENTRLIYVLFIVSRDSASPCRRSLFVLFVRSHRRSGRRCARSSTSPTRFALVAFVCRNCSRLDFVNVFSLLFGHVALTKGFACSFTFVAGPLSMLSSLSFATVSVTTMTKRFRFWVLLCSWRKPRSLTSMSQRRDSANSHLVCLTVFFVSLSVSDRSFCAVQRFATYYSWTTSRKSRAGAALYLSFCLPLCVFPNVRKMTSSLSCCVVCSIVGLDRVYSFFRYCFHPEQVFSIVPEGDPRVQ